MQCNCERSATENKTSGARCSCSKYYLLPSPDLSLLEQLSGELPLSHDVFRSTHPGAVHMRSCETGKQCSERFSLCLWQALCR